MILPPKFPEWSDISAETERKYVYEKGDYVIRNPLKIKWNGSGHLVVDSSGQHHEVASGWLAIRKTVMDPVPVFRS